jgi:DtxR family transcriptional regulator, Mn-dependent transcriptional regulator
MDQKNNRQKKQTMELTENAEEILETLWIQLVEQKKNPDMTMFKDDAGMQTLKKGNYICLDNKKEILTAKGMEEGRLCVRRHRLAERLLADVLHIRAGLIHEIGCKLEHILHKGLEDNICILLGHPVSCPHGSPIPQGLCCKEKKSDLKSLVLPMSKMRKGQKGKIAYIHTEEKTILTKIMAMGALPGLSITLIQRFPSYVFQMGESQFAVDKKIAEQIKIWIS